MGKGREINIQENAARRIAETAWFIESNYSEKSAKQFVDDVFAFLEKIARPEVTFRPCNFKPWKDLDYKCVSFRKKYVIAYLEFEDEILICDFSHSAYLK
jgi:hypothetical protein